MPRSSTRKADLQPGLRARAYDLPRAAGASSGAPKRWLAADAVTFASIYTELRPEERHAHVQGARGFVRVRLYFGLDSRSAASMPCEDVACVASSAVGVLRDHISPADFNI